MGWRFYTLSAAGNPRMVSAQGTRAHRLEKETTRMRVRLIWEKVESSGVSLHPSCFPVLYVNARLLFPTGTSGPTTSCLTLFIALFALLEIKSKLYPSGSQSPISLCLYFFAFIAWLHQCGGVQSAESEVAQSCLTVCDPVGCSLPGSSVHRIFQARVLEWIAISFSRGSSWPRDWTHVSRTAGRHFTVWATREALSLSHLQLFSTPWTAARQDSLSFTLSQSLLIFMIIESVSWLQTLYFNNIDIMLPDSCDIFWTMNFCSHPLMAYACPEPWPFHLLLYIFRLSSRSTSSRKSSLTTYFHVKHNRYLSSGFFNSQCQLPI